jgi:hypothetical protein
MHDFVPIFAGDNSEQHSNSGDWRAKVCASSNLFAMFHRSKQNRPGKSVEEDEKEHSENDEERFADRDGDGENQHFEGGVFPGDGEEPGENGKVGGVSRYSGVFSPQNDDHETEEISQITLQENLHGDPNHAKNRHRQIVSISPRLPVPANLKPKKCHLLLDHLNSTYCERDILHHHLTNKHHV